MAGAAGQSCKNGRVNNGVFVERTGSATYRGANASGARVLIGRGGNGPVFTPGELLQIALAACSAMSSDAQLESVLGPNFTAITRAVPKKDSSDDRYTEFNETMEIDLSGLDAERKERLINSARNKIATNCTVGNTIMASAEIPAIEFIQPQE